MPASQINYGKPTKSEANLSRDVVSIIIWSSMQDGIGHGFQQRLRNLLIALKVQFSANAAHRSPVTYRWVLQLHSAVHAIRPFQHSQPFRSRLLNILLP